MGGGLFFTRKNRIGPKRLNCGTPGCFFSKKLYSLPLYIGIQIGIYKSKRNKWGNRDLPMMIVRSVSEHRIPKIKTEYRRKEGTEFSVVRQR